MKPVTTIGRVAVGAALLGLLPWAGGCSGKSEQEVAKPGAVPAAEEARAADAAPAPRAGEVGGGRMANAVVTSKTAAPVDLEYDLLAKPAVGQALEIELAFHARAAADRLEVEVTGMPGLVVANGASQLFETVGSGDTRTAKVLVQADAPGLYYVAVVAKMVTPVQIEARTFSVPVAFGAAAAAEKPAPAVDATGAPVHPLPAVETTDSAPRGAT